MFQTDLTVETESLTQLVKPQGSNRFRVLDDEKEASAAAQSRIRSGFGTHFDACVCGFLPHIAEYEHSSGSSGIIGFRRATDEKLYLENYLPNPIDIEILAASGRTAPRERIVEVGQFIVDDRNIVSYFFRDLVPFLAAREFEWICFTATRQIRSILDRVGFRGLPIRGADQEFVCDTGDSWGSYFENDPVVIVGRLSDPSGHWCSGPAERAVTTLAGGA